MLMRRLGRSGIEVSAIGLGCLSIGGPWTHCGQYFHNGEVDDAVSIRAIHRALDLGINFFDTAANYGAGHSERILGKAIAGWRDKVVIATKFGYAVSEETRSVGYYGDDPNSDQVANNIYRDCEASLRRLDTDYIDLYLFHIGAYPPEGIFPVRDALEKLVDTGKIRFYGWSTDNPEGARIIAQGEHCVAIELLLNVIDDNPGMLAICDEFEQASINMCPLARGMLTGKYNINSRFAADDWRSIDRVRNKWLMPTLEKLELIREVLKSDGRTVGQGALAWIWARSKRTIPIPGFRTIEQVEENAAAMDFGPLSDKQMKQIEELLGLSRQ